MEQGEEKSARRTIREYLYRFILERDTDDSDLEDLEDTTNKAGMTYDCIIIMILKSFTL